MSIGCHESFNYALSQCSPFLINKWTSMGSITIHTRYLAHRPSPKLLTIYLYISLNISEIVYNDVLDTKMVSHKIFSIVIARIYCSSVNKQCAVTANSWQFMWKSGEHNIVFICLELSSRILYDKNDICQILAGKLSFSTV